MAELNFERARVGLYDPAYMNRQITLGALQTLGFSYVEPFAHIGDLERHLGEHPVELVIAELSEDPAAVRKLVRRIRERKIPGNPFVTVLLTTWDVTQEAVRCTIDSGADDLLARPFSIKQVRQRIAGCALNRKPFVVTADYVGPSRRKPRNNPADDGLFDPPNGFRSICAPKPRELRAEHCDLAWRLVEQWRLVRLGSRARVLGDEVHNRGHSEIRAPETQKMLRELAVRARALSEMMEKLSLPGLEKMSAYCVVLERVTGRLTDREIGNDEEKNIERLTVLNDVCTQIEQATSQMRPRTKSRTKSQGEPNAAPVSDAENPARAASSAN